METISYKKFLILSNEIAYRNDIPANGMFELTPLCNLNCKMCYVHLNDPSVKNGMLTGEQWISIMKDAAANGMISALLTGGEAMTHPDFWDIYMHLINSGVSPRIKTNGLLLNEQAVEKFKEFPPYLIDVSLYGCDSESYVAVTEVDAFEAISANIRRAIDAGLQVRIMITPSDYMSPWIERVMKFAKSFGVTVAVNNVLIEPNSNTGRKKEEFDLSDVDNDRISKLGEELFPPKYMTPEEEEELYGGIEKRPDVSERGLYCNGGRTGFAVCWDGTMLPCLSFPRDVASADVKKLGFEAAWKQVNEGVRNYVVPAKCRTCPINDKCHYCPTQHGKYAARHECDPNVCAHWIKHYRNN